MTTKLKTSSFIASALALIFLTSTTPRADASLIGYVCGDVLCTGGGNTIVLDQGAGDNFPGSAVVGQVNLGAIGVGGFTIVTNVSQSKPLIGSNGLPQLDLSFSAVTSDNLSHTVFLYASDTDFTGGGPFQLTLGGTQAPGADGDMVTARAWGGSSNTNLDLSNLLAVMGPTRDSPFAFSSTGSLSPTTNPFSATIGIKITRASAGTTTGDLNFLVGTPEPASLILFGTALLGLGCARRRAAKN